MTLNHEKSRLVGRTFIILYNTMETQLDRNLQMNYLQKDTLSTLAEALACD